MAMWPSRPMVDGACFIWEGRAALPVTSCRRVLPHTCEPFGNKGLDEAGLLVHQSVAGAIKYGKGGAGVVLDQLPRACVSCRGILSAGKDQHWMRIGFRSFRPIP